MSTHDGSFFFLKWVFCDWLIDFSMNASPVGSNEFIMFRAKGNTYKYVKVAKEWSKTGESCAVMILHDKTRNSLRIVGISDDNDVTLESPLFAGLEHELRKTFLQWRDGQRILGIKFSDEGVAKRFELRLVAAVQSIGVLGQEDLPSVFPNSPAPILSPGRMDAIGSPQLPMKQKRPSLGTGNEALMLAPKAMSSRHLFQRVESMSLPEQFICCCCGVERNDLLLKPVSSDNMVETEPLRIPITHPQLQPRKICTSCWIRNLSIAIKKK